MNDRFSGETLALNLRLIGRFCVVVGGGPVGLRKCGALVAAGARVRLVDPRGANLPIPRGSVEVVARKYQQGDLRGAFLVVAATGDRAVNRQITEEAGEEGALLNVADEPSAGDVFWPAAFRRGALEVAVSTSGRSPALASRVRNLIAESIGPEWAGVVEIAAALRRKRLTHPDKIKYDQGVLQSLLENRLPALVAAGDRDGIDRVLERIVGENVSLAALEVTLPEETT